MYQNYPLAFNTILKVFDDKGGKQNKTGDWKKKDTENTCTLSMQTLTYTANTHNYTDYGPYTFYHALTTRGKRFHTS